MEMAARRKQTKNLGNPHAQDSRIPTSWLFTPAHSEVPMQKHVLVRFIVAAVLLAAGPLVGVQSTAEPIQPMTPSHHPDSVWAYTSQSGPDASWQWAGQERTRLDDGTWTDLRFLQQADADGATIQYGFDANMTVRAGRIAWDSTDFVAFAQVFGMQPGVATSEGGKLVLWPKEGPLCPLPLAAGDTALGVEHAVDLCGEPWTPTGKRTIEGMKAFGFAHQRWGQAWFTSGLPIPLLWQTRNGEVRLVGFEPGTEEWPADMAPRSGAPWSPVDVAKHQTWGPDETGIDHPFPLSQAYRSAVDDPTFTAVQDYLASHPRAVLMSGTLAQFKGQASDDWASSFLLSDGKEAYRWAAIHRIDQGPGLLGLTPVATALAYVDEEIAHPQGLPNPADMPGVMPTVAAVLEREEMLHSDDRANTAWGFTAVCDAGCQRPTWWLSAGSAFADQSFMEAQAAAVAPVGPSLVSGRLAMADSHGETLAHGTVYQAYEARNPLVPGSVVAPGAGAMQGPRDITIVAASVVLAGVVLAWPAIRLLAGLFTRLIPDKLDANPARRRILEAVRDDPGIHMEALARATRLKGGSLQHHVDALVEGGKLQNRKSLGYSCMFPAATSLDQMRAAPARRSPTARQIEALLQARPGATNKEVATQLGMSPSSIAHHVSRLRDAGIVRSQRDGRTVRLWVA